MLILHLLVLGFQTPNTLAYNFVINKNILYDFYVTIYDIKKWF